MRDKAMFLHIRRRRWAVKQGGKIISRNWELTAKGTKFTQEFRSFLKEFNRSLSSQY
ncbi:ISAon1 family transposase N-terminal region protein [Ancylomarina longa]|uniref:ISAon1 family transposase N-terminal region protein n=1 Tax=Ancylomarina longa TaxID=2487017 RepID=UPI003F68FC9B